ncbi:hypothetical protein NUW54_g11701 [Trametes sanguinea]|uniref:Uncharacterized protein n=1 Tax=Trametes sanguinea TaxID=158606 RepID=A0ACC1NAZ5_9APHY|nr:hypothetical protein NUW54_g11701 [Trametes sanguinea]
MIHGNPVDITDTGIDPTFLEALPDDMREEVLNQHVRDQRAAQVERPADSQISAEFLDALPPDIRAEIIQQEAMERAQRTRTEQAVPPAAAGAGVELDPASFIASLDPQLRQVVLMDSDDVFIQSLPSHMVAEANIHREHGRAPRARRAPATQDTRAAQPQAPQPPKGLQPRDAIQLLEKSALAALIRLLFYPHILKKNLLYKVLVNLCENAKSRTDLFNLLLSILQDGSGDLASIDKSFAQMSVRHNKPAAPQTPKAIGKQRVSADYFGSLALPQNDVVPELIVQRCLEALTYIVTSNELSSLFFLTEHELPIGLRRSASKKGKGKEKQAPQTHYPIVLLLSLLDRPSILRTPSIVESVVALLATVTRPLASLKNKKEDASESSKTGATSSTPAAPSEQAATQAPGGSTKKKTQIFIHETWEMLKRHWLLCIYAILLMTGFNFLSHGSQDLYPTYLTNAKLFSDHNATVATIIGNCGAIAGGAIAGWLSQYIGRRLTIIIFVLLIGAFIPLWILPTSFGALAAGAFCIQFGVQGAWGVIPIQLAEISPPAFRATFPGVAYQLGNMVSSASAQIEASECRALLRRYACTC